MMKFIKKISVAFAVFGICIMPQYSFAQEQTSADGYISHELTGTAVDSATDKADSADASANMQSTPGNAADELVAPDTDDKDEQINLDGDLLSLQNTFVKEKSSPFSHQYSLDDNNVLEVTLKATNGSYIYKDSINVSSDKAVIYRQPLNKGSVHKDIQGTHEVYFNEVSLNINILKSQPGDKVVITYQGCDSQGICYPPQSFEGVIGKSIDVKLSTPSKFDEQKQEQDSLSEGGYFSKGADAIASSLADKSFLSLFLCFILGSALMLTPCVLPMLPIFSAMILGSKDKKFAANIMLNLSFAAGLSLTYMLLGLLFAYLGAALNSFLQNSVVTLSIAGLFVLFALSSAGLFDLKMPSSFSSFISSKVSAQKRGVLLSAFLFGSLSALLSTPCTSAPLAGALLFVMQGGDVIFGALAFLAIGLGMATPLFIIGLFGSRFLPKSSKLSEFLKRLLALPLLLAAWYIARVPLEDYMYALNVISSFVCISYTIFILISLFYHKKKTLFIISSCIGFIATFAITTNLNKAESSDLMAQNFVALNSIDDLKHFKDKKILLDFKAKWCTNCKIMEKEIFSNEMFLDRALKDYHLVSFDITNSSDEKVSAMMQSFEVIGVPYIVILNEDHTIKARHIGYADLKQMLNFIDKNK